MAKLAIEHEFTGSTALISAYDSTKTCLGTLIKQATGATTSDKWVGPMELLVARPMEVNGGTASNHIHVLEWSTRYNWIFIGDGSTAALTRKINFFTHDKTSHTLSYNGAIILNFVTNTGNKAMRGVRAEITRHTTGTIAVSGTSVTGSGTSFVTSRIAAGSRIGFGSTDHTQITTWYEISSIAGDESLTLTSTAGVVAAGTSYVIEELRVAVVLTNATLTNGGLFLLKGLRPELFAGTGTNVAEASTTDNVRGIYWLADAATVTNTVGCGLAVDDSASTTNHFVYVLDTTGPKVYKYNLREALSNLSAGKSTSAFILVTGTQTVTGTVQQNNNGRIATASHGPGNGIKCLYFATTTRIYRCIESQITSGSTTWIIDAMTEVPKGSTATYPASGAMYTIDYSGTIDKFIISTAAARVHLTSYKTDGSQFDNYIFVDSKQLDQNTADSSSSPYISTCAIPLVCWSESGFFYILRVSTSATMNQLYCYPATVDNDYSATTLQRVITPSLATVGATKFYRVAARYKRTFGSGNLKIPSDTYRIHARTSGISDNSGTWTLIDETGDLSAFGAADSIQLMIDFNSLGFTCLTARIFGVIVTYEDAGSDYHYQPSVKNSNITNKNFAWRFSTAFGTTVPALKITLYDAVTSILLLTDTTSASAYGVWERSVDGGSTWSVWTNIDKGNETTYLRYTPTVLGDNIKVKAVLALV